MMRATRAAKTIAVRMRTPVSYRTGALSSQEPSMKAVRIFIVAALALLAGCSKNQQPQQQPPPGQQITGNERLGWTQPAADAVELAGFKYAIYVDGTRSTLADASCSTTPGSAGFDCSAALPRMSAGSHT